MLVAALVQVAAVVAWVAGWTLAFGAAGALVSAAVPVFALGLQLERRR